MAAIIHNNKHRLILEKIWEFYVKKKGKTKQNKSKTKNISTAEGEPEDTF